MKISDFIRYEELALQTISDTQEQLEICRQECINQNAKFKIGDKVSCWFNSTYSEEGIITKIDIGFEGQILYCTQKIKKNGEASKMMLGWHIHEDNLELVV